MGHAGLELTFQGRSPVRAVHLFCISVPRACGRQCLLSIHADSILGSHRLPNSSSGCRSQRSFLQPPVSAMASVLYAGGAEEAQTQGLGLSGIFNRCSPCPACR